MFYSWIRDVFCEGAGCKTRLKSRFLASFWSDAIICDLLYSHHWSTPLALARACNSDPATATQQQLSTPLALARACNSDPTTTQYTGAHRAHVRKRTSVGPQARVSTLQGQHAVTCLSASSDGGRVLGKAQMCVVRIVKKKQLKHFFLITRPSSSNPVDAYSPHWPGWQTKVVFCLWSRSKGLMSHVGSFTVIS